MQLLVAFSFSFRWALLVVLFIVCFSNQQKLDLFDDYFRSIGTCSENEKFVPQTKSKISTTGSFVIKKKIGFLRR